MGEQGKKGSKKILLGKKKLMRQNKRAERLFDDAFEGGNVDGSCAMKSG